MKRALITFIPDFNITLFITRAIALTKEILFSLKVTLCVLFETSFSPVVQRLFVINTNPFLLITLI